MTPSMLTKLDALRLAQRSIFIIATNYAERLDMAIKRTGRIDEHYLLFPPGSRQRRRLLGNFLSGGKVDDIAQLVPVSWLPRITRETALFTWGELKRLAGKVKALNSTIRGQKLARALVECAKEQPAALTLAAYEPRINDVQATEARPVEEFLLLTYLYLEAGRTLDERLAWVKDVIRQHGDETVRDETIGKVLSNAASASPP